MSMNAPFRYSAVSAVIAATFFSAPLVSAYDVRAQSAEQSYVDSIKERADLIIQSDGPNRDMDFAVALLTEAVRASDTEAMRKLAKILVEGDGIPMDPARAEALLQQAVAAGDVKSAADDLGDLYRAETALNDPVKAVAAYQQAADAGNTSAMRRLARILAVGDEGVAADPSRAEALLQQALAAGDVSSAAYDLGDLYRAETPLNDPAKAVVAYQQAADAGNTEAMRTLAGLLIEGDGVRRDPVPAEALLQQAIAAGDVRSAADDLGDLYRAETPLKDPAKAVAAYQQAADAGNTSAMRRLARILVAGDEGVAADPARAEALLEQAIAANDVSSAAYDLGDLYRAETPLNDPAKAVVAYQQAADAGNTSAMRRLARILVAGDDGVAADPARAEALLQQAVAAYEQEIAANDGEDKVDSLLKLAGMLTAGRGIKADPGRARPLLERAFSAGSADAAFALGELYSRSDFRGRSRNKAREYYEQAAAADSAPAHLALIELASADLKNKERLADAVDHARRATELLGNERVLDEILDLPSSQLIALVQYLLTVAGESLIVDGSHGSNTAASIDNYCKKKKIEDCNALIFTRPFLNSILFEMHIAG